MPLSHNVVISVFEPGLRKVIQAGKFVQAFCPASGAQWVYQYDIPLSDRMECLDSWGVAPCVLRAMEDHHIGEIHYYNGDEDMTYITTVTRVRDRGILQAHRGRRVFYYHLPLAEWRRVPGRPCTYPYATERMTLQWVDEPERVTKAPPPPLPVQMTLL